MFSGEEKYKKQAIQLAGDSGLVGDLESTMATRDIKDLLPGEESSIKLSRLIGMV